MKRIGLISDTHSWLDPRLFELFKDVDEIWHAGDIGCEEVLDQLESFKTVRAVYGNIDGAELRQRIPELQRFTVEGIDVMMTHIGGYPGKYSPKLKRLIYSNPPKLFVCGHSHILKVMNDSSLNLLHVNPGAAGKYGFHLVRTAIRFVLDEGNIRDMEVIELSPTRV
ncbi:metallophosphoesterase family protein [Natronoflexus pectinivorans]|uniref:Phosphoesterase n=1 Tax=Natronoflexus pectinivorans TaxID=682526 RepID=A0A4R2GJ20_9BACT|nr:metallophosphoesterase family protein [Natronoflexus pectinivorans]TCO07317.1 hypothetical protein EV194_109136 [Natronoflexus pectinivorans]